MNEFKNFFNKNLPIIFSAFMLLTFIQNCRQNGKLSDNEDNIVKLIAKTDSLNVEIDNSKGLQLAAEQNLLITYELLDFHISSYDRTPIMSGYQEGLREKIAEQKAIIKKIEGR